ncbi:hypothetical protein JQ593_22585 [Bradyrhizobium viridifuturi]|jgi:hypothetical protein|uniref:hypothetical protein n=2 Tax=cellular organisms TaxID=131567 RepID=UPI0004BD0D23|nr:MULTISPECIES: hypothetical protein [Bacteria]MBR1038874.1 hypothetical protein [Bradyrhizobium viridifuturi]MCA3704788.1 hypothetical protein [Methylobacterium sp.]MEE4417442.1 hypothetical protein [Klebsiella pneumoniae]MQH18389.1 hypothetical protein [Escherichia coli]OYU58611.1 MAG: hypothetical protein CFE30_30065 [Bradyrhizobium sp. PARBB1]PCL30562.1 hypothetical protein CPZ06_10265 [Lactobacillus acidophilus]DAR98603.1 MAG TPA: hypothetical protein [Caudoviricetes sp.]
MSTFVYVQGLKGPEPQVWHEKPFSAAGRPPVPLQEHELTEKIGKLTVSELAILYPYKGAYDVT